MTSITDEANAKNTETPSLEAPPHGPLDEELVSSFTNDASFGDAPSGPLKWYVYT